MSSHTRHTISILVQNEFGVLARVSGLFSGRGFNIESLSVAETLDADVSRITLTTTGDAGVVEQINKQLNKLVPVIEVVDFREGDAVDRELALIKVAANTETRRDVMNIVEIFRAKIVDVGPRSYIVQITGSEDKVQAMIQLLRPFDIKEIARTGKAALFRGDRLLTVASPKRTQKTKGKEKVG